MVLAAATAGIAAAFKVPIQVHAHEAMAMDSDPAEPQHRRLTLDGWA
jgi:hypothetical protein